MSGANSQPSIAMINAPPSTSPTADPNARRAASRSCRPIACPIITVAAMPKPNTAPKVRNMMMLALDVAASALSPRKRPTHTALIEPFSDWRMFEPSVGSANSISVRPIWPLVRSRRWGAPPAMGCPFSSPLPFKGGARGGLRRTGLDAPFDAQCGSRGKAPFGRTHPQPLPSREGSDPSPTAPAPPRAARLRPPFRHGRPAPSRLPRAWRARRNSDC